MSHFIKFKPLCLIILSSFLAFSSAYATGGFSGGTGGNTYKNKNIESYVIPLSDPKFTQAAKILEQRIRSLQAIVPGYAKTLRTLLSTNRLQFYFLPADLHRKKLAEIGIDQVQLDSKELKQIGINAEGGRVVWVSNEALIDNPYEQAVFFMHEAVQSTLKDHQYFSQLDNYTMERIDTITKTSAAANDDDIPDFMKKKNPSRSTSVTQTKFNENLKLLADLHNQTRTVTTAIMKSTINSYWDIADTMKDSALFEFMGSDEEYHLAPAPNYLVINLENIDAKVRYIFEQRGDVYAWHRCLDNNQAASSWDNLRLTQAYSQNKIDQGSVGQNREIYLLLNQSDRCTLLGNKIYLFNRNVDGSVFKKVRDILNNHLDKKWREKNPVLAKQLADLQEPIDDWGVTWRAVMTVLTAGTILQGVFSGGPMDNNDKKVVAAVSAVFFIAVLRDTYNYQTEASLTKKKMAYYRKLLFGHQKEYQLVEQLEAAEQDDSAVNFYSNSDFASSLDFENIIEALFSLAENLNLLKAFPVGLLSKKCPECLERHHDETT